MQGSLGCAWHVGAENRQAPPAPQLKTDQAQVGREDPLACQSQEAIDHTLSGLMANLCLPIMHAPESDTLRCSGYKCTDSAEAMEHEVTHILWLFWGDLLPGQGTGIP